MAGDRHRRARAHLRAHRAAARRSPRSCGGSTGSSREPAAHTRLVYVSPLKALAYDVDRNLRAPLRGIGADLSVAIRTGDTPQRERAAMRRTPPDILITTPESLYLILTSQAREMLRGVESVIVDEIHAVASTKRGAHLALTLERLSELSDARAPAHRPQRHAEPAGGGRALHGRPAAHVRGSSTPASASRWTSRSTCRSSRWSSPSSRRAPTSDFTAGGEATRKSIWPAIYPELLEQVRAHRSTIVFVNSRRGAERLALRLNELAEEEISRAHHGSLAREERTVVEEMLKAGELPCLVATSSLELGIDMGAVDLVLQVESPKSVARGLQRIGRAGHSVGDTSKGRIFPKFRADLLECAVVVKLMREGRIEPTVVPRNALDVLAQQIVAIAASAEPEAGRRVDELFALVTRTHSYAELSRDLLENVLDMLDGRYPVARVRRAAPAHRVGPRRRDDPRAQGRAPARGHQRRHDPRPRPVLRRAARRPPRRRARRGDGLRGARRADLPARRLDVAHRGDRARPRHRHARRPACPAPCRSGRATASGARRSSAARSAPSAAGRSTSPPRCSSATTTSTRSPRATSSTTCASSRTPRASCRATARSSSSASATRSATGGCASCQPYGGRVHAAWGLALSRRIREEYGLESDAIWSDDGIIVHLPDADEPPGADLVLVDPDELEDAVVAELGTSALFGARFRENAARSLLIPRAYPGKRTPLWQQRLKSQSLLEVAQALRAVPDHPRDLPRVPARRARPAGADRAAARAAPPRALARRGRDADRLAVRLVACSSTTSPPTCTRATRPTPSAARRRCRSTASCCASCSARRSCASSSTPARSSRSRLDLQHRSDRTRADSRDALADVLRRLGDLTDAEVADRVLAGLDAAAMLAAARAPSAAPCACASAARSAGSPPTTPGLYRDAFGAVPPSGLPEAFMADVEAPLREARRALRAHARPVHHRRAARPLRRRPDQRADARWSAPASSCAASCAPAAASASGATPRSCAACAAPRWPCCARRSRPPTSARWPPSCRRWQGVDRHPAGGRRRRPPARGARAAAGPGAARRRVGARRAAAPLRRLLADVAGPAVRQRRGRVGRRRARSGATRAAWRSTSATTSRPSGRRRNKSERPDDARARPAARAPRPGAVLLHRPAGRAADRARADPGGAVGPRLGRRGDQRRVGAAARAAPHARPRPARARSATRPGRALRLAPRRRAGAGPGPLVADDAALPRASVEPGARRRTLAELLLERYGIVTREQVLAEGIPGGFSILYDALGAARDARRLPARLLRRGPRRRAVRAARRRRAPARAARRRGDAAGRARRHRPGAALRRGAAVAQARRRGAPPAARRPAPTSSSPAPSPCSTSSAAARASPCSSSADDPRIAPGARGAGARSSPPGAGASSRSSASTASRSSARAGRRCSSSSASAPGRASSR